MPTDQSDSAVGSAPLPERGPIRPFVADVELRRPTATKDALGALLAFAESRSGLVAEEGVATAWASDARRRLATELGLDTDELRVVIHERLSRGEFDLVAIPVSNRASGLFPQIGFSFCVSAAVG